MSESRKLPSQITKHVSMTVDLDSSNCYKNFEKSVRESLNFVGLIVFLETWTLSILLVKVQKEASNTFLETGGRRILVLYCRALSTSVI